MFYLLIGVMAGILLAYLVMRAGGRDPFELWRSWRWRLAGVVALLLLLPVVWDFARAGLGSFGPPEAFRTVLLPWLAGVGFGIWFYFTIGPLHSTQDAGRADAATAARRDAPIQDAEPADAATAAAVVLLQLSPSPFTEDAGPGDAATIARRDTPTRDAGPGDAATTARRDAPTQDAGQARAATPARRDRSFIPIAVAMLAVMFIVSDAQYRWLARLQKLSFGGGGLELAPPPAGSGSLQAVSGPSYGLGDVIGEDRVSSLVDFMAALDQIIDRDFQYLHELGDATHDDLLNREKDFADRVVVPLGKHLGIVHEARRYNNLGILIDRSLVDAIRSFVHSHREMKPETRQRFAEKVRDKIQNPWRDICDTEERLLVLKAVDPKNEGLVKSCYTDAAKSTNAWLSSPGGTGFDYALPYGTLLAAMLLNAADELDSAIRDIDEWVADNSPAQDRARAGQSWLVFRALNQAVQLLLANSSNTSSYLAFERSKNLAEIGERLLNSTVDSKLSWQAQRARFVKAEPVDLLWELGLCPNDLTVSFKRAMLATLQASNTVAYILSQNIELAEKKHLTREMEERADYLANKVNTRCLTVSEADNVRVTGVRAAFFDTAAAVELTLAAKGKQQPNEKRLHLCNAYKYAQKAIALQDNTLLDKSESPLWINASPWKKGLSRFDFADKWTTHRGELAEYVAWATYNHRFAEVNNQFTSSGLSDLDC